MVPLACLDVMRKVTSGVTTNRNVTFLSDRQPAERIAGPQARPPGWAAGSHRTEPPGSSQRQRRDGDGESLYFMTFFIISLHLASLTPAVN